MTSGERLLLNISPHDAEDLDGLLEEFDPQPRRPYGGEAFPDCSPVPPDAKTLARTDAVHVGLRVRDDMDVTETALRVAAFAIERDVDVVVFSDRDRSGFERFGMRVERIGGATEDERAACEEQLRQFWQIDLVI